jgi:hypothetical protein
MLKPVKKIITDTGETRIITRLDKETQTQIGESPPHSPVTPSLPPPNSPVLPEEEEEEEYDLHPKLQELLEYFARDDKFTLISVRELEGIKSELIEIKRRLEQS